MTPVEIPAENLTAEILTIGNEILYGQIVDTNTQWISEKLTGAGIKVIRKSSVGDVRENILSAFRDALDRADVIIVTGGLGPTKDDITKAAICEFFETELEINEEALSVITEFSERRGLALSNVNKMQAALPKTSIYLPNQWGTAPGMWLENDKKVLVSLPGVPHEMKNLMEVEVLPRLLKQFWVPVIVHRTIRTIGIGESLLAEQISKWEDSLPSNFKLAYLPTYGSVALRLTGTGPNPGELARELDHQVNRVLPTIEAYVYGSNGDQIEEVVGKMLAKNNQTLGVAESCTGGYVAHKITEVPGASKYFSGSVTAYSNKAKTCLLGIGPDKICEEGAVSEEVAELMAQAAQRIFGATYGLATTGIAGPDGGTSEKPVGTVWIACAGPNKVTSKLLRLSKQRDTNIRLATMHALNLLRKIIMENEKLGIG